MPLRIQYNYGELVGEAYYLYDVDMCIKRRKAAFRCKCGNTFIAQLYKVKVSETQSCGCLHKKATSEANSRHNLKNHKIYGVWSAMKARCYNKNTAQYKDYGERGIYVCEEWKNDFISFYKWAIKNGWQKGLQLDKDTKGYGNVYSPLACCFTTPKINSNKRRTSKYLEFDNKKLTISGWADLYKISLKNLYQRMARGWSFEKCISYNE